MASAWVGPIFVYAGPHHFDPSDAEHRLYLSEAIAAGVAGRAKGNRCEQPVLVPDAGYYSQHDLVDIALEVQQWEAAP